MTWLALCLAGGLGAVVRYLVDAVVNARVKSALPLGAMLVNVTGSLVLGLLTGLVAGGSVAWLRVVGTGFLGGYTTFSTAMVESARLWREGRRRAACWHAALNLGLSLLAASSGLALGSLFAR